MNLSSKLTAAKTVVTSKVGIQALRVQKHSPTILFATGAVGVVASTVMACRATLNLDAVLEEQRNKLELVHEVHAQEPLKYDDKKFAHDLSVLYIRRGYAVAKLYAPAVAVGVVSLGALGGSHIILTRRNAGLMAAYAALDKGFKEYRERVVAAIGPDREKELRYDSEVRDVIDDEGKEVTSITTVGENGASIYAVMFDRSNVNWVDRPEYNIMWLRSQQNWANDELNANGHLFLNEVYKYLGFPTTRAGQQVGWVKGNGDGYVDFGVFDDDSMERFHAFVTGRNGGLLLDFNVDGVVLDLI